MIKKLKRKKIITHKKYEDIDDKLLLELILTLLILIFIFIYSIFGLSCIYQQNSTFCTISYSILYVFGIIPVMIIKSTVIGKIIALIVYFLEAYIIAKILIVSYISIKKLIK